jgi:GNAT superfamily N-acetyltransferase
MPDCQRALVVSAADSAQAQVGALPTMQRNALRKIFDRPDFTPEEVARLGHRRLGRAEGIGRKGLANIVDWLRSQGYELAGEARGAHAADPAAALKDVKRLEKAMHVLQTHGYTVLPNQEADTGKEYDGPQSEASENLRIS